MADISPIRVYVGDDWLVQIALVDTSGAPIDLTGATVGVNFWPAYMAAAVDLVAAGGGISVVSINPGVVLLMVPRSVTIGIDEQSVLRKTFPTRAQVYVDDTRNRQQTATLVPFQAVSARTTDLPSAVAVMTTVTAVLSPQGPAGPSAVPRTYPVQITTAGQTVIPLPMPPAVPSSLRLLVNGSVYVAPDLILGSTTVTWANPDFILEPTDAVTLSFV